MRSSRTMRKLCAAALVFSGGAMAAEAVLVHDIAPPHPRYTQLTQMAAEVAKRTQGTLTIAINPGGKVVALNRCFGRNRSKHNLRARYWCLNALLRTRANRTIVVGNNPTRLRFLLLQSL